MLHPRGHTVCATTRRPIRTGQWVNRALRPLPNRRKAMPEVEGNTMARVRWRHRKQSRLEHLRAALRTLDLLQWPQGQECRTAPIPNKITCWHRSPTTSSDDGCRCSSRSTCHSVRCCTKPARRSVTSIFRRHASSRCSMSCKTAALRKSLSSASRASWVSRCSWVANRRRTGASSRAPVAAFDSRRRHSRPNSIFSQYSTRAHREHAGGAPGGRHRRCAQAPEG